VRRRILQLLADGKPRAASQIAPSVSRRTDATLKPLVALRHAGLLELSIDPVDSRRQLYALSLKVPVTRTEKGTELDFGCCVARVGR
jgi:predicted transcriptional regulator